MGKYIMRSHQLMVGDIVTESGLTVATEGGYDERDVQITAVVDGEIWYKEAFVPVHFVTGTDLHSKKTVRWAKNNWHRWLVERGAVAVAAAAA